MSELLKQAVATRELANRARRFTAGLPSQADRDRLLQRAEELEDQAAELERQVGSNARS